MSGENPGNPTAFFLGIEGESFGPFSQEALIKRIQEGSVAPESLVWWEGQTDWVSISQCSLFSQLFESSSSKMAPQKTPIKLSTALSAPPQAENRSWSATYLPKGAVPEPIYNLEQSSFATSSFFTKRLSQLGLAAIALGFIAWGFFEFTSPARKTPTAKRSSPKISQKDKRRKQLSEATSSLLLKPEQSVASLKELIDQSISDAEGQEAAEVLLTYYRQNKFVEPAAELLLKLERPDEAAKLLLGEPRLAPQAEKALFQAFKKSSGKVSADYLIEDINLILKFMNDPELVKERVLLYEKTFPGLNHPFSYYLQNPDQKIKSLFTRISFRLVDDLASHMSEEFPQLTLATRPIVEVKRTSSGALRIVGRYSGDLVLKSDRLKGIYFLYWLVEGQWLLVDTNLTSDRQNFAASTRKKYENSVLSTADMLSFLENEFKKTYPNQALHETPSSPSRGTRQMKE